MGRAVVECAWHTCGVRATVPAAAGKSCARVSVDVCGATWRLGAEGGSERGEDVRRPVPRWCSGPTWGSVLVCVLGRASGCSCEALLAGARVPFACARADSAMRIRLVPTLYIYRATTDPGGTQAAQAKNDHVHPVPASRHRPRRTRAGRVARAGCLQSECVCSCSLHLHAAGT